MNRITERFDPKTGKFEQITLSPEAEARLQEQVSRRFCEDGKDRLLLQMIERSRRPLKRKSLQPV